MAERKDIDNGIFDAKGDLLVGTGSDAFAVVAAAANGNVPTYDSAQAAGIIGKLPPGYVYGYKQTTSSFTGITATTFAGGTTVLTMDAITFDGVEDVQIEFYCGSFYNGTTGSSTYAVLGVDGSASYLLVQRASAGNHVESVFGKTAKFVPASGSRVFTAVVYVTANTGNANASSSYPMWMRCVKAS